VHGSTITEPGQLAAALKKAAAAVAKAGNSSSPLLEADHVFNPSSQGTAGVDRWLEGPAWPGSNHLVEQL
jgi:hypothetical protein